MRRRSFAACVATLILAVLAAACGSTSSSSTGSGAASTTASTESASSGGAGSGKPIDILDITATSGATAVFGEQETNGLQAAANYYNANGGVLGRKIDITVVNDNSDPATATSIATQQLSGNPGKYAMVWAGEEGTVTSALVPIMKRYNVFATAVDDGDNACAQASNCPNLFTQVGSNSLAEIADAAALKKEGATKVGIIAEQLTYDEAELPFIQKDLARLGINTVTVTFPPTAVSLTPEMSQLKNDGVNAVFAEALGPAAGYVLGARAALGWSVPTTFDITGSSLDISKLAPKSQLGGVTETIHYCMNIKHDIPAFSLLQKYTPQPLNGSVTCPIAGDGWAGIVLLDEAATKAKSLDSAALSKAAETIKVTNQEANFPYVSYQAYCWSPSNHEQVCNSPSDFEVVPIGKLVDTRLHPLG
jgi:branched-chain amino acid transport system substrate-binding protein